MIRCEPPYVLYQDEVRTLLLISVTNTLAVGSVVTFAIQTKYENNNTIQYKLRHRGGGNWQNDRNGFVWFHNEDESNYIYDSKCTLHQLILGFFEKYTIQQILE